MATAGDVPKLGFGAGAIKYVVTLGFNIGAAAVAVIGYDRAGAGSGLHDQHTSATGTHDRRSAAVTSYDRR